MTDADRQRLAYEWKRNEERIASLPVNSAERVLLERRQDEIEYELGLDDLERRSERREG